MKIAKTITLDIEVWQVLAKQKNASAYINELIMQDINQQQDMTPVYQCNSCHAIYGEALEGCPKCKKEKKEAKQNVRCLCGALYQIGQIPDRCLVRSCNRPLPTKLNVEVSQ